MDDAVQRYRARRQARLDARGYYNKARRSQRAWRRFDDDEDGNKGNAPRGGGGHGNCRIPFGLCQREGIQVDPKWTPRDAWAALEGKGYSAGEVYGELRKTGKVGSRAAKAKKPPTRIKAEHFPAGMVSKTMRKNTMEFADYVSDHCDDGTITEFLSMACGPGAMPMGKVSCKRSTTGEEACVSTTVSRSTDEVKETEVKIPMFSKIKNEEHRRQAMMTFCHEWTHFLDLSARERKGYRHFSEDDKALQDAIKADAGKGVGKEAQELFDKFNAEYDKIRAEERADYAHIPERVVREMYGDNRPEWLTEDGRFNYCSAFYGDWANVTRYRKALKEAEKAHGVEHRRKCRSLLDGVSSLQGIYDSLNGGELRASKAVRYGHSTRYFKDDGSRGVEMLADYVALKAIHPQLAAVFERDKPEIAAALGRTIEGITAKLRGGGEA